MNDSTRRVLQCRCARAIAWRGDRAAWDRGWRSAWLPVGPGGALERVWSCPDCWEAPRLPETAPVYALPAELLGRVLDAQGRLQRAPDIEQLLERLADVDRPRAEAYARDLVARVAVHGRRSKAASRWHALFERLGVRPEKPRRRRPRERRAA